MGKDKMGGGFSLGINSLTSCGAEIYCVSDVRQKEKRGCDFRNNEYKKKNNIPTGMCVTAGSPCWSPP